MRNLISGNKVNFTVFTLVVILILVILIGTAVIVLNYDKEEYEVSSSAFMYDNDYNYIELDNSAVVSKKWTGSYYLKEDETNEQYKLGDYSVSYDTNKGTLDLFGTFYQVLKGGDISKITEHNTINGTLEDRFYKIDDRKYLIVAKNIANDTGSLSTQNYLIVIIDKLGNAMLLNNELNIKTINSMTIKTDSFSFDVANELLTFENEEINLKKIIGSTNEYVSTDSGEDVENTTDENTTDEETEVASTSTSTTTTTSTNSSTTTVVQTGSGSSITSGSATSTSSSSDTSWVDSLNSWIGEVATAFSTIYDSSTSSTDKESSTLDRSVSLSSLSAGTTYIDINYAVTDPESVYNVVYANVSDGTNSQSISLDKSSTTYRVTDLEPNTNYTVQIGYQIVYSDATTTDSIEDSMSTKTSKPSESLTVTKVSLSKVYYTLKLDSSFVYDSGATIKVYVNGTEDTTLEKTLSSSNLETAASSGYQGSFSLPSEYSGTGSTMTIQLEDTKYNGTTYNTDIKAIIINY